VPEAPLCDASRPVSFACPDCGAKLKITTSNSRFVECGYRKNDSYLAESLWFSLHPVRKRRRWHLAFG
jgi:hypothetical protein